MVQTPNTAAHGALHSDCQGAPPASCPALRNRVAHGDGGGAAPGLASLRTSVPQTQQPKRTSDAARRTPALGSGLAYGGGVAKAARDWRTVYGAIALDRGHQGNIATKSLPACGCAIDDKVKASAVNAKRWCWMVPGHPALWPDRLAHDLGPRPLDHKPTPRQKLRARACGKPKALPQGHEVGGQGGGRRDRQRAEPRSSMALSKGTVKCRSCLPLPARCACKCAAQASCMPPKQAVRPNPDHQGERPLPANWARCWWHRTAGPANNGQQPQGNAAATRAARRPMLPNTRRARDAPSRSCTVCHTASPRSRAYAPTRSGGTVRSKCCACGAAQYSSSNHAHCRSRSCGSSARNARASRTRSCTLACTKASWPIGTPRATKHRSVCSTSCGGR